MEKVPEVKDLLNKLYMVCDEILAKTGIEDQNEVAKMTNKFIHYHSAILRTNLCVATLNRTMDSMQKKNS